MINISATVAGTIAASGEEFVQLAKTPIPLFVNGAWWAFQKQTRPTAPKFAIISRKSTDNGSTWTEDSEDFFTDQTGTTEPLLSEPAFGNGILSGTVDGNSARLYHKDLDTPGSSWIAVVVNDIAPTGSKPDIRVSFDYNANKFILRFFDGVSSRYKFVTTTDFVTFVDPGTSNLGLGGSGATHELMSLPFLHDDGAGGYILHGGFAGSGNAFGTWTSPDLVTWTLILNADVPSSQRRWRDIRWFKGLWVGTQDLTFNGVNNPALFIHTSTDLIEWTGVGIDQTDPDLVAHSFITREDKMMVTKDRMVWINNGDFVETTDGVTFTRIKSEQDLAPGISVSTTFGSVTISSDFNIKGKYILASPVDGPTVALKAQTTHEDLGGKILKWAGSLTVKPTRAFPATSPTGTLVGFAGESDVDGDGIADEGFSVNGTQFTFSFSQRAHYAFNDGIRQWEVTITGGALFSMGMEVFVPESGASGNGSVLLVNGPQGEGVLTKTTFIPAAFSAYDGMTIGVVANIPAGTIQFYIDGALIVDFAPVLTGTSMWVPFIDVFNSPKMFMNIGQDTFKHPVAGTVKWADGYL